MASNIALTGLAKDLAVRAQSGNPVRIGLVGAGEMGTDIVTRAAMMDGVEVAAISEINVPAAHKAVDIALREAGHSAEAASTSRAERGDRKRQDGGYRQCRTQSSNPD